jgi:defect in organelle trafficking protein DotC
VKKIMYGAMLLLLPTLCCNALANDSDPELDNKSERQLDRIDDRQRVKLLRELYQKGAKTSKVNTGHAYLLDTPMTLEQVMNFEHPYFSAQIDSLTESEIDDIQESMEDELARKMRYQSITSEGMRYGMASGLHSATREYWERVKNDRTRLVNIWPFHALMIADGKIKPPLINEIGYQVKKVNKRQRREVRRKFIISKQSEVIITPPTYMDFFMNLKMPVPKAPQAYLLPLDDTERGYWRSGVKSGWIRGVEQASMIYEANIRKTVEHFNGYIRYHALVDMGAITEPTYQNIHVGTNSRGDIVNLGEGVFEITSLPLLNDDELNWLALPEVDDIFGELTEEKVNELTLMLSQDRPL